MGSSRGPLYSLITVFFFWGFLAASNGVFIPFCKHHFELNQLQSQLVDSAFYGAYFAGSLILFIISRVKGFDLLNHIGYKRGIIYGLLISVLGAVAMIPSIMADSFPAVLASLFIVALGFSLQQTAAQPFVVALGPEETGAHRLNLAGSLNSLGTTFGPIVVALILFGTAKEGAAPPVDINDVAMLYVILSVVFAGVALFLKRANLPDVRGEESGSADFGALKYPQLLLGMLAIFVYVGTEVSIQSNLGALLATPEFGEVPHSDLGPFIAIYWGSLMIGRWVGAISVFEIKPSMRIWATFGVGFLAWAVIMGAVALQGFNLTDVHGLNLFFYVFCVALMLATAIMGKEIPTRTLALFGIFGIVAMLIGLLSPDPKISLFAFLSGGLACSIMWPSIFSLSISGLGRYQAQGSAFLIMMILGGAVIPPIQGALCDMEGTVMGMSWTHFSYIVPVIGFCYLTFFAWKVQGILARQGVVAEAGKGGH